MDLAHWTFMVIDAVQRLPLWTTVVRKFCHQYSDEYIRYHLFLLVIIAFGYYFNNFIIGPLLKQEVKVHLMEHWNASDVSLCGELPKSYFALMVNKKPLIKKSQSNLQYLHFLSHQGKELSNTLSDYGLKIDLNCCALLDAFKDDQYDFTPLMGLSLQCAEMPEDSPITIDYHLNKLANSLGGNFMDLKLALTLSLEKDRNLVAKMQSLLKWSRNWRYCPSCATPLRMRISKAAAFCVSCKKMYYPPLSPVAACLITDPNNTKALLIRHRGAENDVFTIVSGFAQIGESFEETVRREVAEEIGIECKKISAIKASASWPVSYGSLMCGFVAVADPTEKAIFLMINVDEIESAIWFSRADIKNAFVQTKLNYLKNSRPVSSERNVEECFTIPPEGSIAFQLIERWLRF
uniref:NAD(+) diphosphatase n=1 Tax=Syphacia muris TaxID=451379 RepID=A0A0N5AX87_9BILA